MKKLNVIITVIIALAIVGCASVEYEKSKAMELVYETDFSTDDGAFAYGDGEINEIEKGVLHLKGTADKAAWAVLDRVYGNNSTTTFRMKFGEPVDANMNFLRRGRKDWLLMCFNNNNLALISFLDREETSDDGIDVNLISGRWYDVAVSIIDYKVTVSIDGLEIGTVAIDNRLPAEGYMLFQCQEDEFWVDDLRIVAEPSRVSGESVLYETDFSSDDGAFEYGDGGINEIEKGVLHLKKGTADEPVWAWLDIAYGNNSITTFRIKFGEPVLAHINFLQKEGDRLLMCFIDEKRLHFNSNLDGNMTKHTEKKINVKSGRWYDVQVAIADYKVTVSIDGVDIGTVAIDNRLPAEANLNFECHEEYWVDDLRIVTEPSGMKEEQVSGGSVLYETDFSSDDGMFDVHRPIWEVKNGVLHLKGKDPGGHLSIPYGRDSVTAFRLKLSPEKPNALIAVLWSHERGMGHFAILNKNHIHQFTKVENEDVFSDDSDCNIIPGEWHDISISIEGSDYKLHIDGRLAAEATLDSRLPDTGYLFLLVGESEFWVDDLRVVAGKAEGVAERKPEEKPEEREAEKGEIQRKLSDSRIAVVGIKTEDDQEKTATALVSFVIDAFVNVGIGKIMERQDISKILEEYEFQKEDVTDQSTAIEIGKLAGADAISIGSLYKVGSKHYLNIKLISVKTGEIMASSVATAETEDDYFDMCNEAVRGMFR